MNEQVNPEGAPAPDANASQEAPQTDVTTEPKGSEADPSPAAKDPGDSPTPKGVGKRIDELTRNWREAERREAALMRLLESRQAPEPVKVPEKPKTLADFNHDENAYRDHLYAEVVVATQDAAKAEAARWRSDQEKQSRRQVLDERVSKFAETTTDYHEVVTDTTPVSESMAEAIMDTEEGPAILYYLGKNPDIATRMYRLSPVQAGKEIARIEDRIVSERKKAAEKPVSQAPPPAPKIDGADPGNTESDPSKMTDTQYRKWREKQIAQRR